MQGRLNSLQKTLLQWDSLHPYNAVHVARISGRLDTERLGQVIQNRLEAWKLRGLTLDRERGRFGWDGDPAAVEIQPLVGADRPEILLGREVERQLNRPFPDGTRFVPFRFFVLPTEGGFFLGLAYFHVIADAESVVRVMRQLTEDYLADPGTTVARAGALRLADGREPCQGPLLLARRLAALPRRIRDLRHSCRPPCQDTQNLANRVASFKWGPEDLQALRQAGKAWDVTLNDLWLALLLKSLASLARHQRQASRRSQLSVGCIVNTRKDLGMDSEHVLGLFLGSFVVTHAVPEGVGVRDLARQVCAQTQRIKQQRLYLGGQWELAFARCLCSWFSPRRRPNFYLKHHPLWGGITNLNLNRLWAPSGTMAPADYFRAVSTGPAVPLVLAITTVGDKANLTFSYRPSVFEPSQVECLGQNLLVPLRTEEPRA